MSVNSGNDFKRAFSSNFYSFTYIQLVLWVSNLCTLEVPFPPPHFHDFWEVLSGISVFLTKRKPRVLSLFSPKRVFLSQTCLTPWRSMVPNRFRNESSDFMDKYQPVWRDKIYYFCFRKIMDRIDLMQPFHKIFVSKVIATTRCGHCYYQRFRLHARRILNNSTPELLYSVTSVTSSLKVLVSNYSQIQFLCLIQYLK